MEAKPLANTSRFRIGLMLITCWALKAWIGSSTCFADVCTFAVCVCTATGLVVVAAFSTKMLPLFATEARDRRRFLILRHLIDEIPRIWY